MQLYMFMAHDGGGWGRWAGLANRDNMQCDVLRNDLRPLQLNYYASWTAYKLRSVGSYESYRENS